MTATTTHALVDVVLDVNPVPLQRAGRNNGKAFLERRSSDFRDELRIMLRASGQLPRTPIVGDVMLEVLFWRRCTSSANRGDISNLLKAIEDAFNPSRDGGWPGVWVDDRQVVKLYGRIVDSGPKSAGKVHVRITAVDE